MQDCGDSPIRPVGRDVSTSRRTGSAFRSATLLVLACSAVLGTSAAPAAAQDRTWSPRPQPTSRVLPAEFERQEGVLITWDANDQGMQEAMIEIVAAAWQNVNFYILVPNMGAEGQVVRALRAANVPRRAVKFLLVPTDSVWTRDFGPQVVLQRNGGSCMVDCDYGHGDRVGDDLVPAAIAPTLGMSTLRPPITADGGNIQTNGRGLALTTTSILDHNVDRNYTPEKVSKVFRDYYGIEDLVFLEPLAGESTGHVDMFAVFVSEDTVVVGEYDPRHDPVNAELLERNVARLQRVRGPNGPLRIIRVPMPPHDEKVWRTYTNVLFANGTLLVPYYPQLDPHGHALAVATYRKLLPGWKVSGIDCSQLIEWGGAIHCMTMNLARVPAMESDPRDLRESIARTPQRLFTRNDVGRSPDHESLDEFRNDRRDESDDLADDPRRPGMRDEPAISSPDPDDVGGWRPPQGGRPARFVRPHRRQRVRDSFVRPLDSRGRPDRIRDETNFERPSEDFSNRDDAPDYEYRRNAAPDFDRRSRSDEFERGSEMVDDEVKTAEEVERPMRTPRLAAPPRSMFVPDVRRPVGAIRRGFEPFGSE